MYYPGNVLRRFSASLLPSALLPTQHRLEILYDETNRPPLPLAAVHSSANWRRLYAYLDLRDPSIDSLFPIFVANGKGNFIGKQFLETFPDSEQPAINGTDKPRVTFMFGRTVEVLGSVIVSILLHDLAKYGTFRIKIRAYVVEDLAVPMYVCHGEWLQDQKWTKVKDMVGNLGNGNMVIISADHIQQDDNWCIVDTWGSSCQTCATN